MNYEIFTPLIPLFTIFIVFIIAVLLIKAVIFYFQNGKYVNEKLPYLKNESVMTAAEKKCFRLLEQQYGNSHYIFPQVKLDMLIHTTEKRNFRRYWNKINRKSIDFVMVNRQTLDTDWIIELNDYTHNSPKRRERDLFLKKACEAAGLKLEMV